jgi:hypothetical protein
MGKTRNTGKLATQIQFDNSNNLVIGTSASSSFNTSGSVNAIGGITGSIFGIGNPTSFSSSISSNLVSIQSVTASNIARLSNLETKSSSVDISVSSINTFTSSNSNTSLNLLTSSLATTGSNSFFGTQVFSGSVYIANDLIVQGSSSIQYISASSVSIGTNIVQLNTATPSVRYAGLSVQDSGSSAGVTGSILWDSLCNRWIYSNPSTIGYSGGMLMSGPRTSTLGTESPLTCNYIAKSGGGDHLYDSCIIDDGTTTCIKNNLIGTGTACFASSVTSSTLQINSTTYVPLKINTTYGQIGLEFQLNGIGFGGIGSATNFTGAYTCSSTDLGLGTNGSSTSNIIFATGTGSERRMIINSCGYIGIGSAPLISTAAALQIEQAQSNIVAIRRADCSNTGNSRVLFQAYNASGTIQNTGIVEAGLDSSATNGYIGFYAGTATMNMKITSAGNVGISTVAPASLLSAYNTTSTAIFQRYISNPASNGTGGGNRGFDTSFTSTVTSFTGTDSADQGYGYFPVAIVNGQTYTIHFKSTAVNGTLGTIITSTGTNFATDSVQTISLPTITDDALTSIRFTATGAATYIGFAGYRTSGTMSLTISEVSIVSGIPDIETGAIVAYKGIATNRINIQAPTTACIPALGCADCTTGLIISNFDTRYGMLLGTLNTGTGWIQQGRYDGTATSYPLSLNPNGGKIGIGATNPNWLLEICCNTTATGGGGYPAISINNPNDAGYSAYYFFKGSTNFGGMELSNATCHLFVNSLNTFAIQTNGTERLRLNQNGGFGTQLCNFCLNGTYQTLVTVENGSYGLMMLSSCLGGGTYALYNVFNNAGTTTANLIHGNNIPVQISGNAVQVRSSNSATYCDMRSSYIRFY